MKKEFPQLLRADKKGRIYSMPHLETAGMKAGSFFRIDEKELIRLPHASELFVLPSRPAVGCDRETGSFVTLDKDSFAVSAFISPGHTVTYNTAYPKLDYPLPLPLFSYAAVCYYKGEFYTAAIRVDNSSVHDIRFMDMAKVKKNIKIIKSIFPKNRLISHLQRCALLYACPNAKNLFLSRYEAPLPASPYCNAYCAGCISYQPDKKCPVTQPRIDFIPTPEEITEIALYHIKNTKQPIVSFGQGCEGEPLLVVEIIEKSIRLIRQYTGKGTINLNTNASRPDIVGRLFDAGLDTIRVSLNSAQQEYYTRYYRPKGYTFKDVLKSLHIAKKKNGFLSINYLVMPGFTDSYNEFAAFNKFLADYKIDMVQLRNLNIDPLWYFKILKISPEPSELLGIRQVIDFLRKNFSWLRVGYFNPSKK